MDTQHRPRKATRRWLATTAALVLLVLLTWAGLAWWPALAAARLMTLPIVEAERTILDERSYEFRWPADPGALVRIGGAPTPVGATHAVDNDRYIVVPLYEDLGPLTLVVIDKQSGSQREVSIAGAKFAYGLCFDRRDPGLLWIGTSHDAAVYRLDLADGEPQLVCRLNDDSHIFGMDQAEDGALYLGTYPGRKLLRVRVAEPASINPLTVDHPAIRSASYLYRVAVVGESLLLSYSAPAVLLRHNPTSGETVELFRSPDPFIDVTHTDHGCWAYDGRLWRGFDGQGQPLPENVFLPPIIRPTLTVSGEKATVRWGKPGQLPQDRQADISLRPRADGMGITALDAAGNGRLYGATYWNTWLFEVEPAACRVRGLGPLPGGSGEFFHSAWHNDRLIVPSYQGMRYEYDPARPWNTSADGANPRLAGQAPQTHFGTSSVSLPDGGYAYATYPNYHQRGGKLISVDARGEELIVERLGDDLTAGALALAGNRLFAGTLNAGGSGVQEARSQPPQLLELDRDGHLLKSWPLDNRDDDVTGLIAVDHHRLLCTTRRRLFLVSVNEEQVIIQELATVNRLKRLYDSPVRKMVRYGHVTLIVTREFLLALDDDASDVRVLARLPLDATMAAVGNDGSLYLADRQHLYCLRQEMLTSLMKHR